MLNRLAMAALASMLALAAAMSTTAHAQPTPPALPLPSLSVAQTEAGVRITWRAVADSSAGAPDGTMPALRVGDALVPGRRIAMIVPPETSTAALDQAVSDAAQTSVSQPWTGDIAAADVPFAQTVEGESLPDLTRDVRAQLPASPVTIVNDSRMRGVRIVVVAVTPLFERDGQALQATQIDATIPGARHMEDSVALLALLDLRGGVSSAPYAAEAPICSDPTLQPVNPAAASPAWKIRVTRGGMQQVSTAALSAAGVPAGLANLRLRYRGQDVKIRRLPDAIRFFAPVPGDRWNAAETFWLTVEPTAQANDMAVIGAPGAGTGLPSTAIERTIVTDNRAYESRLGGSDGDHWYAAVLRPDTNPAWTFAPAFALPYAGGTTGVTVSGVARTNNAHTAQFSLRGATANAAWSGVGTFTATFNLPPLGTSGTASFILNPVPNRPELALPDRAIIERPVMLNFSGAGAAFIVRGNAGNYQTSNVPDPGSNDRLYDVTDPLNAKVVLLNGSNQFTHAGGDRSYLMTGAGTLWSSGAPNGPTVSVYSPFPLTASLNLNALYLAPSAYLGSLQPLIDLRTSQGYSAGALAIEAIYDWWGHGLVSPPAIRNFLRYAYACWGVKPLAMTLVGDGTIDPLNYLGYGHVNIVPPYMAPVDSFQSSFPEVAETSCDACYAQLDGAEPLSDKLPDLMFARLPVKSVAELARVVGKIVNYETTPLSAGGAGWRHRIAYLADNYRLPPSEGGGTDAAGDFVAFSEASIAAQPSTAEIVRRFYTIEEGSARAKANSVSLFAIGAGIINYVGHGNERQMAVTRPEDTPNHLMYLSDVDSLLNPGRLPIVLQMTCLTSAFQTPVRLDDTGSSPYLATTMDERLVLAADGAGNGTGAIATWGSSGLGVSWGHRSIQTGFYKALWSFPRAQAAIGAATAGGFLELFTQTQGTGEPDDALRTYILLGDALTRARVGAGPYGANMPFAVN
jgi:hypothetical protein